MALALCVVTALALCVVVEAVIVALVLLLGALLCAMWPSPTVAAIGSRALRPAATTDGKPTTPSATHEPPRDLRVGDSVLRRGELCTIIEIDRSVVPFGVTVQKQGTGIVAHTELAFLSLPAECSPRPAPPPLPPPRLPEHVAAVEALAILARVVIGPFRLLRFTELIRLIRQLGRSYRSDEAGDGPATQGLCQGRDGKECRHPHRPVPTVASGTNRRTGQKEYRSWCQACHEAKPDWSGWYPSPQAERSEGEGLGIGPARGVGTARRWAPAMGAVDAALELAPSRDNHDRQADEAGAAGSESERKPEPLVWF